MTSRTGTENQVDSLKIYGWANDHSGCGQYRIGLPMWALGAAGHDAKAFTVLDGDLPPDLDVLVGQFVWDPAKTEFWQQLAADDSRSYAMVYELDDDIWNLADSNPARAVLNSDTVVRVERNLAAADAVTVTTDHLAEVVRAFNPNVHVLPNCFDASILSFERPRAERLTVGWSGSSSHNEDFAYVRDDLKSFFRRNTAVDAHFVGVNHGPEVGRPDARHTGWNANLVDYIRNLDFDIGIAPLIYNAFNRAKSDLKFLEYASLGIPIVASDFGPYALSVEHGVTGMLVKFGHEWSKHLRALVNDEEMRTEIGRNAKAWAETRTIHNNYWRWEAAYHEIVGSTAASVAA